MKFSVLPSLFGLSSFTVVYCHTEVDVVVVGAGLSGLSAARKLPDAGKTVKVLEARDGVGGLDRVIALAQELGLETFTEYNSGNNTASIGDRHIEYDSASLPSLDSQTLTQFVSIIADIDRKAATIDPARPWDNPSAGTWDSMTLKDFRDAGISSQDGREAFEIAVESVWSVRSDELSFLFALSYIAAAGNETTKGTWERLTGTTGGAQDRRVVGGTGLLPEGLAKKIGYDTISLKSPVRVIEKQNSGKYLVKCAQSSFLASQIIVAMAPPLARKIKYSPALPSQRQQATQHFIRGSIGKANAVYSTPFWRDAGLTGQAISTTGVVRTTFDASDINGTYGALLGFIEADQMRALDNASDAEIIAKVAGDYVRYFVEQARDVKEWVVHKWDVEE
ncbi:putative flavin amine oxidase, FAD/NAD(P)-binding domain superfamily [Septoria linicola]|nr:putative flavin amine oxidase, FAD/NAD(P)-binding domain superfamily [Septoria linicola]